MKERIKDYRKFHGQKYFRGNNKSRNKRISVIPNLRSSKRFLQSWFPFALPVPFSAKNLRTGSPQGPQIRKKYTPSTV